jgi:hypothetical protein
MNKVEKFILAVGVRFGLFILITEILKNPTNIKLIKRFIILGVIIQLLFGLIMVIIYFDKDLYKKEMQEIREDYNSNI